MKKTPYRQRFSTPRRLLVKQKVKSSRRKKVWEEESGFGFGDISLVVRGYFSAVFPPPSTRRLSSRLEPGYFRILLLLLPLLSRISLVVERVRVRFPQPETRATVSWLWIWFWYWFDSLGIPPPEADTVIECNPDRSVVFFWSPPRCSLFVLRVAFTGLLGSLGRVSRFLLPNP